MTDPQIESINMMLYEVRTGSLQNIDNLCSETAQKKVVDAINSHPAVVRSTRYLEEDRDIPKNQKTVITQYLKISKLQIVLVVYTREKIFKELKEEFRDEEFSAENKVEFIAGSLMDEACKTAARNVLEIINLVRKAYGLSPIIETSF